MNRIRITLAALILAAGLQPALAGPACGSPEVEQAAQRLLASIDARWLARDAAGMAALYHPQGQLRLQPGVAVASERAGVERLFTQIFDSLGADDDHVLSLRKVSAVGSLCALDAQAVIGSKKAEKAQRFQGFYLVEPMDDGELRIVAVSAARLG